MKERRHPHSQQHAHYPSRGGGGNRFAPYRPRSSESIQEHFKRDALINRQHFQRLNAGGEYQDYVRRHQRAFFERFFESHKKQKCWFELANSANSSSSTEEELELKKPNCSLLFDEQQFQAFPLEEGGVVEFPASQAESLPCIREEDCIVVSNISPDMSRETLSALFPGSLKVQMGLPDPQKQFYRYAWVLYPKESASGEVLDLESVLKSASLEAHQLYACVSKAKVVLRGRISHITEQDLKDLESIFQARNPQLSSQMDLEWEEKIDAMALYERTRNHFCIFCGVQASCDEELIQRCGHVHWRSTKSSYPPLNLRIQKELLLLHTQMDTFLPKRDATTLLDLHFIRKIEDGKFQCRHCEKLFKGPEFVTKHYLGKHPEESERLRAEVALYNQFRADLRLASVIWPFSMLFAKEEHSFSNSSSNNNPSNNSNNTVSDRKYGNNTKREYKDWDAISIKEEPISY